MTILAACTSGIFNKAQPLRRCHIIDKGQVVGATRVSPLPLSQAASVFDEETALVDGLTVSRISDVKTRNGWGEVMVVIAYQGSYAPCLRFYNGAVVR